MDTLYIQGGKRPGTAEYFFYYGSDQAKILHTTSKVKSINRFTRLISQEIANNHTGDWLLSLYKNQTRDEHHYKAHLI